MIRVILTAFMLLCALVLKSAGYRFSLESNRRMLAKRKRTQREAEKRSAVSGEERQEAAGEDVKPDRLSGRDLPVAGSNPASEDDPVEKMRDIEDNGDITEKQASYIRSLMEDQQAKLPNMPLGQSDLEKYGESRGDKEKILDYAILLNMPKRPSGKRDASELITNLKGGPRSFASDDPERWRGKAEKLQGRFGKDFSGMNKAINDQYDKLSDEQREDIYMNRGGEAIWRQNVLNPLLKA